MKSTFSLVFLSVLAIVLVAPVSAQADPVEDEDYVYTNADIERLTPIPTHAPPPPRARDAADWGFVEAFIAGERAKLIADRDHDFERRRVEIEEDRPVGYGIRYPLYFIAQHAHYPRLPRIVNDVDPSGQDPPPTHIPHPIFRKNPRVREFTPRSPRLPPVRRTTQTMAHQDM